MGKVKVFTTILGLVGVGLGVLTIRAYGEYKYYDGRINKHEELKPIIETLSESLKKELEKNKKEEKA